jgi:hypothetical protein
MKIVSKWSCVNGKTCGGIVTQTFVILSSVFLFFHLNLSISKGALVHVFCLGVDYNAIFVALFTCTFGDIGLIFFVCKQSQFQSQIGTLKKKTSWIPIQAWIAPWDPKTRAKLWCEQAFSFVGPKQENSLPVHNCRLDFHFSFKNMLWKLTFSSCINVVATMTPTNSLRQCSHWFCNVLYFCISCTS